MSDNVFDPAHHKIVAIVADGEEKGQHLHVTLAELARDAQSEFHRVDLGPVEARVAALEQVPQPAPPLDLAPLLEHIARLEARLQTQERAVQVVLQALDDITSYGDPVKKAG